MKPKIIIVDDQDRVIGSKDRYSLVKEDIYRVSALWITNSNGEILLARRALNKSHDPGKWGPAVAGTVDEGEDYDENIIKEAKEEIGLEVINLKPITKERVSGEHNYFAQWYSLTVDKNINEFTVDPNEVAEIKWFPKEDLLQEVRDNPDKFLKGVKRWLDLFCK